ncbi:uncharacterized protein [Pseudorasbora parva]|uniref:uncharacterized protein n=1 Tax=Pseudorasbora parva TaxID=51549 RepID=UPI00351E7AD0
MGLIEESSSDWASPIVLVPKTDASVRFCVDYRKVNAVSKFDAYTMPRVNELLDRLGTARFYSTLDLTKGYWQIPLSPLSKEKTAFTTPFGLHQFVTLPFGLFGAPATFQRLMDRILRPHATYAAAYLDDILIYSNDWQWHMEHVSVVLRSLRGAGLTANPKKCAIGRVEVRYLGFHLGHGQALGISGRNIQMLQYIQNNAARVLMRVHKYHHITPILHLGTGFLFHLESTTKSYISTLISLKSSTCTLISSGHLLLQVPTPRAFCSAAPRLWNHLPSKLRAVHSSYRLRRVKMACKRAIPVGEEMTEEVLEKVTAKNDLSFFQELLPSAERTALLFHLSYLCSTKFHNLQRAVRECALETQSLFASSEALLQKCADTSNQMVSSMFPLLKLAVENNENIQATMSLEKAREWITEIVNSVTEMVDRYEKHNRSVASCTSDVILEKAETEKKISQTTKEIEALETVVRDLQMELRKTLEEIGQIEAKISQCQTICARRRLGFSFLAAIVPFVGSILKSIFEAKPKNNPAVANEKAQLVAQKSNLKTRENNIQVRLTDVQLKLANMKAQKGSIPDSVHLSDVQKSLYEIQQTLLKHNLFWKSVLVFVESLKSEAFAEEHFIGEIELKEIVLKHFDVAQENWKAFGESCLTAKRAFSLQNKDAYKFLNFIPSYLTPEEWKRQYDTVQTNLTKMDTAICGH